MRLKKLEVLRRMSDLGVVGLVATRDVEDAVASAEAAFEGGIDVLEISACWPGAAEAMKEITGRGLCRGLTLGCGAVADAVTARLCIDAGAEFISSYRFDDETAKMCSRSGVPYMPAVGSIGEVVGAVERGVDVVLAFPGDVLGPRFVRAALAALPDAHIIPVGGVAPANLDDWFQAGAFAVGVGAALFRPAGAERDYPAITKTAEHIVTQVALIRGCLE